MVAGANGVRYDYVIATRGGAYLFAYSYTGRPFDIRMGAISAKWVLAWWYDPRDGSARQIGAFVNHGVKT